MLRRVLWRGGDELRGVYRHCSTRTVAVKPDDAQVKTLLASLAGLDLHKVMARRKEPLLVPHYKLMTLEQLQEVGDGKKKKKKM